MTTPKPLESTIDRFNELLDMLEKEYNKDKLGCKKRER